MAPASFIKTTSGPLYRQVASFIEQRLADGTYPTGSALPSEAEWAQIFDVSRPTVRHALRLLITEGLIESIPGRGTYVVGPRKAAPKRTGNVGLVVLEMRNHFVMRIVNGAENALAARGYRALFCNSGNEIGIEQAKLREIWDSGSVDGFLIMPADSPQASRTLAEFASSGIPLVFVDRFFASLAVPFVASDDLRGGYLVTRHLLNLGHRRIAFLTRPNLYVSSVAQRLQGYRQALQEAGLAYDAGLVFQGLLPFLSEMQIAEPGLAQSVEYERAAIRDFFAQSNRPTAVFACNDGIAVQAMEVCRAMGLHIPRDIALVGYADEPVASVLTPPLTTAHQRPYEMGARAADKLLDILDLKPVERDTFLPVELVVRESCGAGSASAGTIESEG